MENEKMQVENINEAINVLIQVAHLAQSRGILTFEDAVKTKSAIDFFTAPKENKNQIIDDKEHEKEEK